MECSLRRSKIKKKHNGNNCEKEKVKNLIYAERAINRQKTRKYPGTARIDAGKC
jgi:hypothetical protein